MSIRLANIFFSYPEKRVLEGFNFKFPGPGTVMITGANGSGKTTLLKLIAGILKPQEGIIETYKISEIGYVPENPVLWENFTVKEQLEMMAELYSVGISDELKILIYDLGLNDFSDVFAQKLSNGYRRKLNFLLSILHNPKLLILDEIFNALDESSIEVIIKFLQQYAMNRTVIIATNRVDILGNSYDEVILLKETP